jgi:hypothetical protein
MCTLHYARCHFNRFHSAGSLLMKLEIPPIFTGIRVPAPSRLYLRHNRRVTQCTTAEAVIKLGVRSTHSSCRVRRNTCCCSCLSLLPKPPPPPPLAPGDATVNIASASNVSLECPRGNSGGGSASLSTGANCCVVRARAKAFVSSGKASFDFDVDAGREDNERLKCEMASGVAGA